MAVTERRIPTVLLVDDDVRVLAASKRSLGATHRVLTATTIAEARAQCASHEIHTAIVDLRLGSECGLDLLHDLSRASTHTFAPRC